MRWHTNLKLTYFLDSALFCVHSLSPWEKGAKDSALSTHD
jgi:hypothetical protein